MTPATFNCTVLRDGHQSLAATRMSTEQMLEIAMALTASGYHFKARPGVGATRRPTFK